MKHSDGHILEVSKSQAGLWLKALELMRRRILVEQDAQTDLFGGRIEQAEVDVHFFLVALLRYHRSVRLAAEYLPPDGELRRRIDGFHEYLGIKRTMRNVGEHFDEYLVGRGRDQAIDSRSLQVWSMDINTTNLGFSWLGETFDLERTMREAATLWAEFLTSFNRAIAAT